jgi:uncharacterized protein involved in exopolysaccharide biosynthesis
MNSAERTTVLYGEPEDGDIILFVRALRARRLLIAVCVLAGIAAAVGLTKLRTPIYTAEVSMLPPANESNSLGMLGFLAAQTGFPLELTGIIDEAIYERILRSRRLLLPLTQRQWERHAEPSPASLFEVFGVDRDLEDPRSLRVAEAELLSLIRYEAIEFKRDPLTGYMVLRVSVPDEPGLAAEMANALAHSLEDYNDRQRFNRASKQRELIEQRLGEIQTELQHASDELANFVNENRRFADSPVLSREYSRLYREVRAQEYIWEELRRQHEVARIDELRNMVVVEVLDLAIPPVMTDGMSLPLAVAVGALAGAVLALLILVAVELRRRLSTTAVATT